MALRNRAYSTASQSAGFSSSSAAHHDDGEDDTGNGTSTAHYDSSDSDVVDVSERLSALAKSVGENISRSMPASNGRSLIPERLSHSFNEIRNSIQQQYDPARAETPTMRRRAGAPAKRGSRVFEGEGNVSGEVWERRSEDRGSERRVDERREGDRRYDEKRTPSRRADEKREPSRRADDKRESSRRPEERRDPPRRPENTIKPSDDRRADDKPSQDRRTSQRLEKTYTEEQRPWATLFSHRPHAPNASSESEDDTPIPVHSHHPHHFKSRPKHRRRLSAALLPGTVRHFQRSRLVEVLLMSGMTFFACYKIAHIEPNATFPDVPRLPLRLIVCVTAITAIAALYRPESDYYRVPFTDDRGYRSSKLSDDGIIMAILMPLLLCMACYYDVYSNPLSSQTMGASGLAPLTLVWEAAGKRAYNVDPASLAEPVLLARTLLHARYEIVWYSLISTLCLVVSLIGSRTLLRIDKLPKSNAKRFFGYMFSTLSVSLVLYSVLFFLSLTLDSFPISPLEGAVSAFMQQSSFYIVSRLARRGFTLGEMTTMIFTGNVLCLEFWRLTTARWLYKRGGAAPVASFRYATPVIAFQSLLIPGVFIAGFLVSPLLVINRHISMKPSYRMRWPNEREFYRKMLALGVGLGLLGIVFFFLGGWMGWMLGGGLLTPWSWVVGYVWYGYDASVYGKGQPLLSFVGRWRKLFLLAYWFFLVSSAVGGWQTRLVHSRRKLRAASSGTDDATASKDNNALNKEKKSLVNTHLNQLIPQTFKLEEGRKFHANLNLRRKFFHLLATALFVPGIMMDPHFTSLAFSGAFALFVFCEYMRYFAIYPLGAPLHIFFSEFIDWKDGPVVVSHFYLLTGCAGGVWLGGGGLKAFSGVLVLGVGDAVASIVGKMAGRIHWPYGSPKTLEGTLAFVVSVFPCAVMMRIVNIVDRINVANTLAVCCLSAVLEANSAQNDNIFIPLYFWLGCVFLDV